MELFLAIPIGVDVYFKHNKNQTNFIYLPLPLPDARFDPPPNPPLEPPLPLPNEDLDCPSDWWCGVDCILGLSFLRFPAL